MRDLPWENLERAQLGPEHLRLLREIVLSELTTFSASKRFLQEFADDVDFTQWIAVWLYEETKHSQAFMRLLELFGERVTPSEVLKARITTPFMKSRTGTLTSNVISELIASTNYGSLWRG